MRNKPQTEEQLETNHITFHFETKHRLQENRTPTRVFSYHCRNNKNQNPKAINDAKKCRKHEAFNYNSKLEQEVKTLISKQTIQILTKIDRSVA